MVKLCKGMLMLTLKIQNPEIETIFLEGFNSNKEMFFDFVKENYNKMILLNSLERSTKQAKLQDSQELDEISLDDLIADVKNSTDT
jgi:hypothetical protein